MGGRIGGMNTSYMNSVSIPTCILKIRIMGRIRSYGFIRFLHLKRMGYLKPRLG